MKPFAILNQIRKENAHVCGHTSRPSPASATTPSGWIEDGIIYNDDDFDDSWDSVAEVKMRSNAVLRWEYRPGSTLFVVWQQSRDRDFDDVSDPRFRPAGDLSRAFADDGDSIFLIKLNRWFGL